MRPSVLLPLLLALPSATAPAQSCQFLPSTTPGVDLGLHDDDHRTVQLPFVFPFQGGGVTEISVVDNGFVWLGAAPAVDPADATASASELLAAAPRVAACWADWNPDAGGAVLLQATATQVSVAWRDVPAAGGGLANMELVLSSTGRIDLCYAATMRPPAASAIVGASAGNGAAGAAVDWSLLPAIANGTAYELFTGALDLAATSISLLPASPIDYLTAALPLPTCPPSAPPALAAVTPHGAGCPADGTGTCYELFGAGQFDLAHRSLLFQRLGGGRYAVQPGPGFDGGYATADRVAQGDDTQVSLPMTAMGGFPFAGGVLIGVDVCSNGYVWMSPSPINDFSPTAAELAGQGARVAPLWADWNFHQGGPGLGGAFYWTARASHCMATWENVAAFGHTGSRNTFQVQFFANGDIAFNYAGATNPGAALVGLSGGIGSTDTGSIDLGAAAPGRIVDLNPVLAAPLTHAAGTAPLLGRGYAVTIDAVPAGATIGVLGLGLTPLALDLGFLGAPGCSQWTTLDAALVAAAPTGSIPFLVPIPRAHPLIGTALLTQGAVLAPGINAAGLATSNALVATIGL